MAPLAWLAVFVGAVLVGADVAFRIVITLVAPRLGRELDPFSAVGLGALVLGDVSVTLLVTLLSCALLRAILGRLSGLQVGVIAVVAVTVYVLVLTGGAFVPFDLRVYYLFLAAKLGSAVILGAIPRFRSKALGLSPPSRFRGLGGTYAFSAAVSDSPSVAVGRRHAGERRWTLQRATRPDRWAIADWMPPPRQVPVKLVGGVLFRGGAAIAWATLLAGAGAAIACLAASRAWLASDGGPVPAAAASPWPIALPLLAIGLLRFGIGRLYEQVRLLRLLRDGQLIHAVPVGDILPGPPPLSVTSVERGADQLIVVTPAPALAGVRQALLVGPRGDVAAWDLLPYRPAGASAGSNVTG